MENIKHGLKCEDGGWSVYYKGEWICKHWDWDSANTAFENKCKEAVEE